MRACEQCGLSIGDSATFCTVCGARVEPLSGSTGASPGQSSAASGSAQNVAQSTALRAGPSAATATEPALGRDALAEDDLEDATSRRLHVAALPMRQAGEVEKTDPARAVTLYRDSALRLLEAAADPLDHEAVRHDLLVIFDRVSLILKREGRPEEALEEIDSAASLGLLDCRDRGIKGHREALKKRRESLHQVLDGRSAPPV